MCGRIELDVGCDQYMIADGNRIAVYKCAVHIDGYMIPNVNISSIITEKRLPDRYIGADFSKQLLQNTSLFFTLFICKRMIFFEQFSRVGFKIQKTGSWQS